MVTLPVVLVSDQGSMVLRYGRSDCNQNKPENPLHHVVAYLCMMKQT